MGLIQLGLLASNSGCDPSGAADCLAAINAAGVKLTGSGGVLYFGAGTYKVSAAITWPANVGIEIGQGVTFTGAGAASVTALATGQPTGPGVAGQFLKSNGPGALPTWAAAGSSATGINFDIATALYAMTTGAGHTPAANAGNFTMGTNFSPLYQATILGVRFYWKNHAGGPFSVKCSIWNGQLVRKATVTVAGINADGFYTGIFASPYTVLAAEIGQLWAVSFWETSGSYYTTTDSIAGGSTTSVPMPTGQGTPIAQNVVVWGGPGASQTAAYSVQGNGDAYPGANEPAFQTCPVSIILQ